MGGIKMEFVNKCDCIFEEDILEKAINMQCDIRGFKPNKKYNIFLYRGYAGISLKHEKVSIHRIIGEYMFGSNLPKNMHVHHIDKKQVK